MVDHFKVYEVDPVTVNQQVYLRNGQFDPDPVGVTLDKLLYFANPVEKNDEKIKDRNAHFTWYHFDQSAPQRSVTFDNQFDPQIGQQTWTLGDLQYLLVPAYKQEADLSPPRDLDHYKAYAVLDPLGPMPISVVLTDQFDPRFGGSQTVKELTPAFFCVPVQKNEHEISHPEEDLAVYRFDPPPVVPQFEVPVKDQFGQQVLRVIQPLFLCVPSFKAG
jgi:hypothetical protein